MKPTNVLKYMTGIDIVQRQHEEERQLHLAAGTDPATALPFESGLSVGLKVQESRLRAIGHAVGRTLLVGGALAGVGEIVTLATEHL